MDNFFEFIKKIIILINHYKSYDSNIFKKKKSDKLFVLGSGSSINKIEFWDHIRQHDSIGFNYFLFHKFIPRFYIFESTYKSNNYEYNAQLKLIKYKLNSYKKASIYLKIRNGYQDIKKIFKEKKIKYSVILDYNINLSRNKLIKNINKYLYKFLDKFFFIGQGVGTVEKICLKAFYSGYKSIILCGVDLKNISYFFYKKKNIVKELRQYIYPVKKSKNNAHKSKVHTTADPFHCKGKLTVQDVLLIYQKYLFKNKCVIYNVSKKSLLYKKFPLYKIK